MSSLQQTRIIIEKFGGIENLKVLNEPLPQPRPGEVRIQLTCIGMNHADLMARKGLYRLASGDPPFTPGLEGGGIIDMVGEGVSTRKVGDRVVIAPDVPRLAAGGAGGTYRSHYPCPAEGTFLAPANLPDDQLGALWLPYLTAWGALIWKHGIKPGQFVAMPAASSSVALAAAQIVKKHGGIAIGLTTSQGKVEAIKALPGCAFEHVVVTVGPDGQPTQWFKDLKRITADHGVDVFFDPVAAGAYLDTEIKCLAQHGCIFVYGLLGKVDKVDVTPLIRKHAAIRGWALAELVAAGRSAWLPGCEHILAGFADGSYRQHIGGSFKLADVRHAQEEMEKGKHIGKLVMIP